MQVVKWSLRKSGPLQTQRAGGGTDLHDETMGIGASRLEVVMTIEARSSLVDRVDDDQLPPGGPCGSDDRVERSYEQLGAETVPLESLVQRELGQEDRRNLARGAASEPMWQLCALYQVGSNREVTSDQPIFVQEHIGA